MPRFYHKPGCSEKKAKMLESGPMSDRNKLIAAVQAEFRKHKFDVFVDVPPSVAQGGKGVVVPGCMTCQVRLQTTEQFVQHLAVKIREAIEREA